MARAVISTAVALALIGMTMAGVGASPTPDVGGGDVETDGSRVVVLDPAAVVSAIDDDRSFELPTVTGDVAALARERVKPLITYTDVAEDGTPVTSVEPPNVWWLDVGEGSDVGLLLAFPHTLRAWIWDGTTATGIEPLVGSGGADTEYRVYQAVAPLDPPSRATASRGGDELGTLTHIKVWKDVYAYVDTQFRDQYGSCCWASQVNFILNLLNAYFDDVELEYDYLGGQVDTGFSTNNMNTAWNRLITLSYNGADVRSYWSFRDFDGCEVGTADFPGDTFIIQHRADLCHFNLVPSSDGERAYLTAHELGKNNNAHPSFHWSDTTLTGHEHRSIMDDSLLGHYHGCWSQTNMNRMSSFLGTSSVGTAC